MHNLKKILYRSKDSYKNDFGHVLVIGSSYNMPGAGVLCANASIRAGAGLVTFSFPDKAYPAVAANLKPEIMLLPLHSEKGQIAVKAKKQIIDFIISKNIDSVVIGCGTGVNDTVKDIILYIIKNFYCNIIIDADGINSLQDIKTKDSFCKAKAKIILTPHPKEFERISLLNYNKDTRIQISRQFAKLNNAICVLKGNKTIITDGNNVIINKTGNPGMATAGSGDVLAGILGAFVSNKYDNLLNKVAAGVFIHGLAGDYACRDKTETSLISSDIIEYIPKAIRSVQ